MSNQSNKGTNSSNIIVDMRNMELHRLSISQFASICNISAQTLRIYDRDGLLHPIEVSETGYRYYDIEQSTTIQTIKLLQNLDFPLHKIKELQDMHMRPEALVEALEGRLAEIEQEIDHLRQKKKLASHIHNIYKVYSKHPAMNTITLEMLPEREVFLWEAYTDTTEAYLKTRQQFHLYLKHHCDNFYGYGTGSYTKPEHMDVEDAGVLIFDGLFIEKSEYIDDLSLPTAVLPAGLYLTSYTQTYKEDYTPTINLLNYAKENHYIIDGFLITENLKELSMSFSEQECNFLEAIRVPIRF